MMQSPATPRLSTTSVIGKPFKMKVLLRISALRRLTCPHRLVRPQTYGDGEWVVQLLSMTMGLRSQL
jgi:hypothetical protein